MYDIYLYSRRKDEKEEARMKEGRMERSRKN